MNHLPFQTKDVSLNQGKKGVMRLPQEIVLSYRCSVLKELNQTNDVLHTFFSEFLVRSLLAFRSGKDVRVAYVPEFSIPKKIKFKKFKK